MFSPHPQFLALLLASVKSASNSNFNLSDQESGLPVQLLTALKDSPAGVKEGRRLPRPETLQHVEDTAMKLLTHDEAAAVMRHCRRVSSISAAHALDFFLRAQNLLKCPDINNFL